LRLVAITVEELRRARPARDRQEELAGGTRRSFRLLGTDVLRIVLRKTGGIVRMGHAERNENHHEDDSRGHELLVPAITVLHPAAPTRLAELRTR
jgi:hypothetical protein